MYTYIYIYIYIFSECELRGCKIRSLSMRSISCYTKPHILLLHSTGLNFFSVAGEL